MNSATHLGTPRSPSPRRSIAHASCFSPIHALPLALILVGLAFHLYRHATHDFDDIRWMSTPRLRSLSRGMEEARDRLGAYPPSVGLDPKTATITCDASCARGNLEKCTALLCANLYTDPSDRLRYACTANDEGTTCAATGDLDPASPAVISAQG